MSLGYFPVSYNGESGCKKRDMDNGEPSTNTNNSRDRSGSTCSNCADFQVAVDGKDKIIRDLRYEIDQLRNELRKSSDEVTKLKAERLEEQQLFENPSNPLSSIQLSKRFQDIKDGSFYTVSEGLENSDFDEVKVIHHLNVLMKKAYEECCKRADQQIRVCLRLDDSERIPPLRENRDVYKLRFKVDSRKDKREKIVSEIVSEVMKDANFGNVDVDSQTINQLHTFLHEFTDCVWLMTIVEDRLVLDFGNLNELYVGDLAKRFGMYTPQGDVVGPINTVMALVWPCVNTYAGGDLKVKGEVLVSNKGVDTEV